MYLEPVKTLVDLIELFLETIDAPWTKKRYRTEIDVCVTNIRANGHAGAATYTAEDIDKLRKRICSQKIQPATENTRLKALNSLFRFAIREGLMKHNPVQESLDTDPIVIVPFSQPAFDKPTLETLLILSPLDWVVLILLRLYLGINLSVAVATRRDDFDPTNATITIRHRHSAPAYIVPVHPLLFHVIQVVLTLDTDREFLCGSLAGRPASGCCGLGNDFRLLAEAAGIQEKFSCRNTQRKRSNLVFSNCNLGARPLLMGKDVPRILAGTWNPDDPKQQNVLRILKQRLSKLPTLRVPKLKAPPRNPYLPTADDPAPSLLAHCTYCETQCERQVPAEFSLPPHGAPEPNTGMSRRNLQRLLSQGILKSREATNSTGHKCRLIDGSSLCQYLRTQQQENNA